MGGLRGLGGKGRTSGRDPEEMGLQTSHACPPRATVGMVGAARGAPRLSVLSWVLGPPSCWIPRSALLGSSLGSSRKRLAGGPQATQPSAIPRVRTGPRPPRSPTILHGAVTQERAPDAHSFWRRPHAGSRLPPALTSPVHTLGPSAHTGQRSPIPAAPTTLLCPPF